MAPMKNKMRKLQLMLRKCKSLSRQLKLKRSTSYTSLRSNNSTKEEEYETIFVGSSRRRYVIDSKYLSHPLFNALLQKSNQTPITDHQHSCSNSISITIMCEVVLFDHLLWMLDNGDPNLDNDDAFESLDQLADLYLHSS
ncbi:auxin-responsive protein SAUR77 [Spinacia oleracea]|uniref:Auxin-responsive protein SAUR77 n=1 Tax=Spinacia oleracea TaxID=3562 RepID=A0ABM3R591_SPIOL|nr:auxin-responsive protein SAUR77 [Spinacia oleracea]